MQFTPLNKMEQVKQLQVELTEAQKKRLFLEEQLKSLVFCINVLRKEVAYRTI